MTGATGFVGSRFVGEFGGDERREPTGRDRREPVSVILPTLEWGPVPEQLAAQLRPGDELLVVCDSASDPVFGRETPERVEVLAAGEPDGCSGKANAMACGMERARNDRFVWTDDDFDHGPNWLDRLVAAGRERGPATVVPYFVGPGWWRPVEPMLLTFLSLPMYLEVGAWGDWAWGGGVTFAREEVDVDALVADLRRSLSDDGVLTDHLRPVATVKSMRAAVRVPGDFQTVVHRVVRLARIPHLYEGFAGMFALSVLLVGLAVAFPLPTALVATAVAGGVYATLGVRRWTFLLAYLALFVMLPTTASGILVSEFEWGGRRYRMTDVDDVEVLGPAETAGR